MSLVMSPSHPEIDTVFLNISYRYTPTGTFGIIRNIHFVCMYENIDKNVSLLVVDSFLYPHPFFFLTFHTFPPTSIFFFSFSHNRR